MLHRFLLLTLCTTVAGNGKWAAVAKWRGMHKGADANVGEAVGLCTTELIAKRWIITAGHCATRVLKKEKVHVQITFAETNPPVKRGIKRCIKCNRENCVVDVDVAMCELTLPINKFEPLTLNSDKYTTYGHHGPPVYTVGTSGGYHAEGPKPLEYEGNGAHLYVHKKIEGEGGVLMRAGDSGGGWIHQVRSRNNTNHTVLLLSGVLHGGGIAAQVSHMRTWIDRLTNNTAKWNSVTNMTL